MDFKEILWDFKGFFVTIEGFYGILKDFCVFCGVIEGFHGILKDPQPFQRILNRLFKSTRRLIKIQTKNRTVSLSGCDFGGILEGFFKDNW